MGSSLSGLIKARWRMGRRGDLQAAVMHTAKLLKTVGCLRDEGKSDEAIRATNELRRQVMLVASYALRPVIDGLMNDLVRETGEVIRLEHEPSAQ